MIDMKRNWKTYKHDKAQSIIEFTFAMVIMALLIFGLVRTFQWAGLVLADHRFEHDYSLTLSQDPLEQLSVNYYTPRRIDGVFRWGDNNNQGVPGRSSTSN